MSTVAVILIVIGVLIVVGLLVAARTRTRGRELEDRRGVAREHREEATSRGLVADKEAAAADEQAARARREAAEAEERARAAGQERQAAEAHHEHAARVDPDADGSTEARPSERTRTDR